MALPTPAMQQIFIAAPSAGTQVGSPVVLTGRVTYVPPKAQLSYRVRDQASHLLGQGVVPTIAGGRQASFTASVTFTESAIAGSIVVELSAPAPGTAQPISTSIALSFG